MDKFYSPLSLSKKRSILICSGTDCQAYLNRLFSCDISKLSKNTGVWGCLLTPQGKLILDFLISLDDNNNILIDCAKKHCTVLMQILNKYKLREKVNIEESSYNTIVFLQPNLNKFKNISNCYFADPRDPSLGWRCYVKSNISISSLNTNENINNWHKIRITLGVFDSSCDLLNNKSYPLEMGFDAYSVISWNKGCYIGQEVTARIKHRSLLKKHLIPVMSSKTIDWHIGEIVYQYTPQSSNLTGKAIGTCIAVNGNYAIVNIALKYYFNPDNTLICQNQKLEYLPLPRKIHNYFENLPLEVKQKQ